MVHLAAVLAPRVRSVQAPRLNVEFVDPSAGPQCGNVGSGLTPGGHLSRKWRRSASCWRTVRSGFIFAVNWRTLPSANATLHAVFFWCRNRRFPWYVQKSISLIVSRLRYVHVGRLRFTGMLSANVPGGISRNGSRAV